MFMKYKWPLALFCLAALNLTLVDFSSTQKEVPLPAPTNGETIIHFGEEESKNDAKSQWLELLHQAAPGTDWKAIEHQNRLRRHRAKANRGTGLRSGCEGGLFADGLLSGSWRERGSINQAGSVFDTEYDPATDELWLISAGGSLWRGLLDGSHWEIVNQDLRFTPGMLEFIPYQNGRRMIAFTGRIPHYSDDDGYTWQQATGISHDDRWGNIHSPILVQDSISRIYVLAKPSYWADIQLYRSTSQGEIYSPVSTFNTNDFNRLRLSAPHHYGRMMLVEKAANNTGKIYHANPDNGQLDWINPSTNLDFGGARANLAGTAIADSLVLYAYTSPAQGSWEVWRSVDKGMTWSKRGDLPARPWDVGLFVSPDNPDVLYMGEVECFRSLDGGQSWEKINDWWAYYADIANTLHADIMHFDAYKTADGIPFTLISNHGGLSVSYDQLETVDNIGMEDLNVSQYYSVRTDPTNHQFVYAGSQDQGFQRSRHFDDPGIQRFDQVISGDYGHIVFSNDGQYLWTVYPGGWVSYYQNPQNGGITGDYDLESEDESVWLPPLMASPFPGDVGAFMAGGNIDGGPGSYLIRLDPSPNGIAATQIDFDFAAASGDGELSAMEASPLDYNRWYAATTNGRFFTSNEAGYTWEQTVNFIPEGHYLYGQTIYASTQNVDKVYLGGSGYSNPPVYVSIDGGQNFTDMSEGLPSTLVFEITGTPDEAYLFAATEAGPYVFITAEERWYYLGGDCSPAQTYWSVEYLPEINTARFGTYGRGIWDFELDPVVANNAASNPIANLAVAPNPVSEQFTATLPEGTWQLQLFNSAGQRMQIWTDVQGTVQCQVASLPNGTYYLLGRSAAGEVRRQPVVLQR